MQFDVWLYALGSVLIVSAASLIGIVTLVVNVHLLRRVLLVMVSLAIGALFGDVFFHLIPELFRETTAVLAGTYILGGIILFFVLEKFLRWYHIHDLEEQEGTHFAPHIGYTNLFADALHNFVDGAFIGISYMVSIPVGIATTLTVLLHEIPQEVGDFGVLVHAGFTRKRALFYNFLSALVSVAGLALALVIGERVEALLPVILGFTAGTFIYLAGSDLVPELHKEKEVRKSVIQLISMTFGMVIMYLLLFLE